MAHENEIGKGKANEKSASSFSRHRSLWASIVSEEGGAEWKDEILELVEQRMGEADRTRKTPRGSPTRALAYLAALCRNTTRGVVALKTGLFQSAVQGDRRAAEDLLFLYWGDLERVLERARVKEFDSIVLERVVEGFINTVTSRRTRFRATSPDVLPKLLKVICRREAWNVRREHGLVGDLPVREVPLEEAVGSNPATESQGDAEVFAEMVIAVVAEEERREELPADLGVGLTGELEELLAELLAGITREEVVLLQKALVEALESMPANHRTALLARASYPGWTMEQLAEAAQLDVKPALFRTWLKRGRDYSKTKLRELVERFGESDLVDAETRRRLRRLKALLKT